jgi:hypothetical protein
MNWYVFSTVPEDDDESLSVFGSYAEAVFEAQCRHDTKSRPKRSGAGLYMVSGEQYSSYVANRVGMLRSGFGHLLTAEREMPRRKKQ